MAAPKLSYKRMGNLYSWFIGLHGFQIFHHFFAHGDKRIAGLQKIMRKRFIARSFFMRNYIVCNGNYFGMPVLFYFLRMVPSAGPINGSQ